MTWALAALLALPRSAARAKEPLCRGAEAAAPRSEFASLPASAATPMACGAVGGEASNYFLTTDADAPAEVHVVAVDAGQSSLLEESAAPGSRGLVKVALRATRKPAILALAASSAVRWDLKLTPESRLSEIVLLGDPRSDIKGAPADVPVLRRGPAQSCGLARAWEGGRRRFRRMIGGLRCLTGLRETSFQGCAGGFFFQVPHYRQDAPGLYARGVPRPACASKAPAAPASPVLAPSEEWAPTASGPARRIQK